MEPIVDGLEEKYGRDFRIVRVDIDTARGKKLAREHGFIGQPTFIFFGSGGEEVRRLMGPQDPQVLEREIDRVLQQ
jgi:thioredoxin-like negative regulator of GroEL